MSYKIVLDEAAIIKEILYKLDLSSSNNSNKNDVEITKIPHLVDLKQCNLLIQYIKQQKLEIFVKNQDLLQLQSLLK
ncbi:14974_t:CDS:2 [Cetraspora pellucida]|uniref:14974_t:CDS:1 n=1 Tax=Cetraspora pellucida TaxID=1433469 RepID=A0A9N8VFX9_9GLOM|nr:14974_t:CDS:2 [Cetraspora pellucida]